MATLNPYISFRTEAAEALEFYRSVLGGTVETMTFDSMGDAMGPVPPEAKDLVMHGSLTDRKSTRQNSSHNTLSRMPSSA